MTNTCGNNQLCHTSKKLIWQLSTTQDVPAIPTPGQVKVTSQLKYCNTQTETPHGSNTINVNTQTELTCYIVWIIYPGLFKFIYSKGLSNILLKLGKVIHNEMVALLMITHLKMSAGLPNLPFISSGARYLGSPSWASEKSLPCKQPNLLWVYTPNVIRQLAMLVTTPQWSGQSS